MGATHRSHMGTRGKNSGRASRAIPTRAAAEQGPPLLGGNTSVCPQQRNCACFGGSLGLQWQRQKCSRVAEVAWE
jgi:hypothetical protein